MSFNGSGTFSIQNVFVPGTMILSAAVNANYTDIAAGLSNTICKDGQQTLTANIPMSTFRITGRNTPRSCRFWRRVPSNPLAGVAVAVQPFAEFRNSTGAFSPGRLVT
jgi:hypothetical protein